MTPRAILTSPHPHSPHPPVKSKQTWQYSLKTRRTTIGFTSLRMISSRFLSLPSTLSSRYGCETHSTAPPDRIPPLLMLLFAVSSQCVSQSWHASFITTRLERAFLLTRSSYRLLCHRLH
eukprot:7309786-Pyramimonas_sp.AAC.1